MPGWPARAWHREIDCVVSQLLQSRADAAKRERQKAGRAD
jgi:hypothetical protein